jgi:hypothetical protein
MYKFLSTLLVFAILLIVIPTSGASPGADPNDAQYEFCDSGGTLLDIDVTVNKLSNSFGVDLENDLQVAPSNSSINIELTSSGNYVITELLDPGWQTATVYNPDYTNKQNKGNTNSITSMLTNIGKIKSTRELSTLIQSGS